MKNSSITLAKRSCEPERAEPTPVARALVKVIALYQRVTAGRVTACRFYPSCSSYALEAVQLHGAVRGGALALRRLSLSPVGSPRCGPGSPTTAS